MRTSLDRQIAILTAKKNDLPDRPERMDDKKATQKAEEAKPAPLKEPTLVRMLPNQAVQPAVYNTNIASSNTASLPSSNGNRK
jgi:hypothetical protein